MANDKLIKYPRTPHIEGSGIQRGDEDNTVVPLAELEGKYLVVEEKIDGSNVGLSFDDNGKLLLQCRGHYLGGIGDWPHFDLFKQWANTWQQSIQPTIADRYIIYGEWMSAFHSVFYDILPHYFFEFDMLDKSTGEFVGADAREAILSKISVKICSVPLLTRGVCHNGIINGRPLLEYLKKSYFTSRNSDMALAIELQSKKFPAEEAELIKGLNKDGLMEGLYLKWEEDGRVKGRYKYVRPEFVQTIIENQEHWSQRPAINNLLTRLLFEI